MIPKRVVGIAGMPGSGKSIADEVATEMGFSIVIMGDIIREETAKRGLNQTPENIGKVMVDVRKSEGSAVVAKRCIPKILEIQNRNIIVEGIRNLAEVKEFHSQFPDFKLIAIHASPETRFNRILKRNRSDDSIRIQKFSNRDLREVKVGIGSAIVLADYAIVNEDSLRLFKTKLRKCFKAILSE